MRHTLPLALLSVWSPLQARSPYRPFPEGNAGWVEQHGWLIPDGGGSSCGTSTRVIRYGTDTVIDGTTYHRLYTRGQGTWRPSGMALSPDRTTVFSLTDEPCDLRMDIVPVERNAGPVSIAPNAARERITVTYDLRGPVSLSIHDAVGRVVVAHGTLSAPRSEIDVGDLRPGVYVVHLLAGDGQWSTGRLMRE